MVQAFTGHLGSEPRARICASIEREIGAVSKHETYKTGKAPPKPVALTPHEVQQIAAGTTAALLLMVGHLSHGPIGSRVFNL